MTFDWPERRQGLRHQHQRVRVEPVPEQRLVRRRHRRLFLRLFGRFHRGQVRDQHRRVRGKQSVALFFKKLVMHSVPIQSKLRQVLVKLRIKCKLSIVYLDLLETCKS